TTSFSRDNRSELSSLLAVREKDGSFLVKAGFLKSHHTYEVVFTLPEVPALGRELSTAPSSSPSRRTPNLRVQRIGAMLEGKSRTPPSFSVFTETRRSPSPPEILRVLGQVP
uniref:Uncharacterized protein n=1 Tax=Oryzias sinensis TaxID=183150 RepID=A0A8C7WT21_9TELE